MLLFIICIYIMSNKFIRENHFASEKNSKNWLLEQMVATKLELKQN